MCTDPGNDGAGAGLDWSLAASLVNTFSGDIRIAQTSVAAMTMVVCGVCGGAVGVGRVGVGCVIWVVVVGRWCWWLWCLRLVVVFCGGWCC